MTAKTIQLIAVAFLLAACASGNGLDGLRAFTAEDLTNAHKAAIDAGDTVAAGCYMALLETMPEASNEPEAATGRAGAFTAFQKGRNIERRLDAGVSKKVHVACAPLIVDLERTLIGLGVIGAKVVK